ncbi:MAG TPA: hypothetical protein HA306_06545 [Methanosarcina sp.]|nr:hypothetical protein [Methanosarcina sp.]
MRKNSMTIEKLHSGIKISDMVDGQFVHRNYIGYSATEAKKLFREYVKTLKARRKNDENFDK